MPRIKVLLAVEAIFDGDYYEPGELSEVTWGWISGTLEDRDDLKSAELTASLTMDAASMVRVTFQGEAATDTQHWAPLEATPPELSPEERQFLSFALDQAAEEMTLRDGFTEDDQTALEKFRGWVGER